MKNIYKVRILAIIALAAVVGFSLAGCESKEQREARELQEAIAEMEEIINSGDLGALEEKLATASPEVIEKAALMAIELINYSAGNTDIFNTVINAAAPEFAGILTQKHGTSTGDFGYGFNSAQDGVVINYYSGSGGVVIIPSEIDGFPVVEIASRAFSGRDTNTRNNWANRMITSLIIPDSVTKIGDYAFSQMEYLTSLTLPKNLAVIPVAMSYRNANLSELRNIPTQATFPPWNAYTPSNAFQGNGKLPLQVRKQLQEAGYKGEFQVRVYTNFIFRVRGLTQIYADLSAKICEICGLFLPPNHYSLFLQCSQV